jgi:hypothetical protein
MQLTGLKSNELGAIVAARMTTATMLEAAHFTLLQGLTGGIVGPHEWHALKGDFTARARPAPWRYVARVVITLWSARVGVRVRPASGARGLHDGMQELVQRPTAAC